MGASIGVGLGLRHVLPPAEARRVVSVIGDSTFVHSGISGLVEMAYNPPPTGHVVLVLDNGTTAMTGQQEHPATGRTLDHGPTNKLSIEGIATRHRHRQRHRHRPVRRPRRLRAAAARAPGRVRAFGHRRPPAVHPRRGRHSKVGAAGGRAPGQGLGPGGLRPAAEDDEPPIAQQRRECAPDASPTSSSPVSAARASSRLRTSSPTRPFEPASTSRRPRSTA